MGGRHAKATGQSQSQSQSLSLLKLERTLGMQRPTYIYLTAKGKAVVALLLTHMEGWVLRSGEMINREEILLLEWG